MKNFLFIILLTAASVSGAVEKVPGGWTESGTLPYSYSYARSYIGHQMRKDGWVCKMGFTAGAKREQEHSVWQKGKRKMQVMIWRIGVGKTGYSKGEIITEKQGKKRK